VYASGVLEEIHEKLQQLAKEQQYALLVVHAVFGL